MDRAALVAQVMSRFLPRSKGPEALFLLSARDAADYVDALYEAGVVISGIEGFFITSDGAVQPSLELSNDVADHHGTEAEFVAATKEIISAGARVGACFEVVP